MIPPSRTPGAQLEIVDIGHTDEGDPPVWVWRWRLPPGHVEPSDLAAFLAPPAPPKKRART